LLQLRNSYEDQILEQRPLQIVQAHLVFIAEAKQRTGEAGVIEVELGRLDESLVEVGEPRDWPHWKLRSGSQGHGWLYSLGYI